MRLASLLIVLLFGGATMAEAATVKGKIVSKKKKYLKNTVVFIEKVAGTHKPPAKPVQMDQRGSKFIPKLLAIVKGTTVEYLNNDPTEHNVYSPDGEKFNLGNWKQGESRKRKYDKEGAYTQLCKMHPAMLGWVIVLQNPHFAIANKKTGEFTIKNVPAGKHKIMVWNPRRKAEPVEVDTSKAVDGVELKLKR